MADDLGTLQPIGAFPKQGSARRSHPRGSAGPNVPSASLRPHLPDRFDRSEDCWNPIATMKNSCTNLSENHKSGSSCDCSQNDRTEEKGTIFTHTTAPPRHSWVGELGVGSRGHQGWGSFVPHPSPHTPSVCRCMVPNPDREVQRSRRWVGPLVATPLPCSKGGAIRPAQWEGIRPSH